MAERNVITSMCKPLPKDVRSLVRSGIAITNVAQCVEELVLNSVDAKATTIYVGVNLDNFNIRVEDDGIGLSKHDLEAVGSRYTTSKCQCLDDLSALRHYGYRGEALASIIDVSASVDLIGRTEDAVAPYQKRFVKGKTKGSVEKQPECKKKTHGLNVIISNLLSELPVRQKRVDKSIQHEEIKSALQHIALINPFLSIECRNEANGSRLLEFSGFTSFADAFRHLYGIKSGLNHINLIEEHHLYNGLFFTACIGKETHRTKNFQLVYVNKRYIGRGKIHRHLDKALSKLLVSLNRNKNGDQKDNDNETGGGPVTKEKYAVFIINIKCPLDMYDITLEPKKMQVEFRDMEVLVKGLDGLVLCFQSTLQSTDKCKIVKRNSTKDQKLNKVVEEQRKSNSKVDEQDEDYGHGVTTHDVKRAVHSRFAVRENVVEDCSEITSNKSLNVQKSIRTVSSSLEQISINSSRTGSKFKPSQTVKPGKQQVSVLQSYRLNTRPTRTTTYDIRLLNRKRKTNERILAPGLQKPKIYVSRKPRVNAGVFKKFPQWGQTGQPEASPRPIGSNSSQSLSINEIPTKRPKKSSLEERFGYKKKQGYSQVCQTLDTKNLETNKIQTQKEIIKQTRDDAIHVDTTPDNEMTEEEMSAWKWKINRYLKQCQVQQKASEIEKEVETNVKSQNNEMTKNKNETDTNSGFSNEPTVNSKPRSSISVSEVEEIQQNEHSVLEKDNKKELEDNNNCVEAQEDYTWAIDVTNAAMEKFAERLLKGKNRFEEITREIRQKLESSQAGRQFLKLVEGIEPTETENNTSMITKTYSGNILKPATFGKVEFTNSLLSFVNFSVSDHPVKPPLQRLQSFNGLPLKTPDPYGLNSVIKSRTSSFSISNPSSSISSLKSPAKTHRFGSSSFKPLFVSKSVEPQENIGRRVNSSVLFLNPPVPAPSAEVDSKMTEKLVELEKSVSSYFNAFNSYSSTSFESIGSPEKIGQNEPVVSNLNPIHSKTSTSLEPQQKAGFEKPLLSYLNTFNSKPPTTSSKSSQNQFDFKNKNVKEPQLEEDEWGEWEVDIVSDFKGQDWLQTEDDDGKKVYINLATGASSYDMINIIMETRISAGEAAKRNKNFRYDWLRRYFPKGSCKFWKPEESKAKIQLQGNISLVGKDNVLGKVVVDCIKESLNETTSVKWRDGLMDSFNREMECEEDYDDADKIRLSEYWNRPVGLSEIPVSSLNAPEMKFWNKIKGNVQSSFRFAKQDLARVKVLTQLDRKFIVAKVSTSSATERITDLLVLFDQHAVHERIRLERLLEDLYVENNSGQKEMKRFSIVPSMPLTFSETEVRIMQSYKEGFEAIGVNIEPVSSTSVKISSAPKCFAEKVATENIGNRESLMRTLLSALIQEQVHHIIDTKWVVQSIPKTIFNILCSQACHGAIKFGDELELSVCQRLITDLKDCKAPFQCAHGRPVLVPLLDLASLKNVTNSEPPMAHYDYTAESPDGSMEFVSSQGKLKPTEDESPYFESSSGYFSSEQRKSVFVPIPTSDRAYEFSLFN